MMSASLVEAAANAGGAGPGWPRRLDQNGQGRPHKLIMWAAAPA